MASLLQMVWVVVLTFGAPAFSVLAFSYWRQEQRGSIVLRVFTGIAAAAFLCNLATLAFSLDYPAVTFVGALLASVLPPMMTHLVLEQEHRGARFWRVLLALLYAAAGVSALAGTMTSWSVIFDNSGPFVLVASSLVALIILTSGARNRTQVQRRQRIWNLILFSGMLVCGCAVFSSDNPLLGLVPDYLLLVFFAVRLYYTERLAFFDSFVKGGSYAAAGAALLALVLYAVPAFRNVVATDSAHTWLAVVALLPAWFLGPPLFNVIARLVDRALHRKYSPVEAERVFVHRTQAGASVSEFQDLAVSTFEEIFQCRAEIDFGHDLSPASPSDVTCPLIPGGRVRLLARESQIPFLSADRRLLETLAATSSVLLQNIRLRSQRQEQLRREQELAALASRAELRALRAQINPHFLFNALNAIGGWIHTDAEFADETIAQLAEVFRHTLNGAQHEWVHLRDDVEFMRAYLAVEQARFAHLETDIRIQPEANAIQIPAMIIQPLVENAIKHGVSRISGTVRIGLTASVTEGVLCIEVSDNGDGFPPAFDMASLPAGHGLQNVRDRLKGYYGANGTLRCENTPMGSRTTIAFPIRNES